MSLQDTQNAGTAGMPSNDRVNPDLPQGSETQQIAFVSEATADQKVLLKFPHPMQRRAVLVKPESGEQRPVPVEDLVVLTIPSAHFGDVELQGKAQACVDAAVLENQPPSLMMTLQGAQVFWRQGRLAILAQSDRLDAVRTALIEGAYYEGELRDIERTLGEAWPQLEADMPLAFQFDEGSRGRLQQLLKRFQEVLTIRARLARISPLVHCPHLHPPPRLRVRSGNGSENGPEWFTVTSS